MAMNKEEKRILADALLNEKLAKALHFTEPVEPDVMPPTEYGVIVSGYIANEYAGEVREAFTSNRKHGLTESLGNDGTINMYSSKLLALKALRNHIENEAAYKLYRIDNQIKQELKKQ